jgi:transcription elongation GreA/GreB family factor
MQAEPPRQNLERMPRGEKHRQRGRAAGKLIRHSREKPDRRAEVINASRFSGNTIKFGATVTVIEEDTGVKRVWRIVGEPEADAHSRLRNRQ